MAKRTKFVANRRGFREAILQNEALGAQMQAAAERVAPPNTVVTTRKGRNRMRTTIFDGGRKGAAREAQSGHLSRALNGMRL